MQIHIADAARVFRSVERRVIPTQRSVTARLVPTGTELTIPAGVFVTLTQALGGTYTVVYNGNMARIEGEDADALGFEPEILTFEIPTNGKVSADQVWEALRSVHDPEIPVNIVDLGLVYDVAVHGENVAIEMTLTAPGCGMGPVLVDDVKRRLQSVPLVSETDVRLVFDPPWSRDMMSEEAQLDLGLF